METILATLPDKFFSGRLMAIEWQVSRKYDDFVSQTSISKWLRVFCVCGHYLSNVTFWSCLSQVPLGSYPDRHFDEPAVLQMIQDFQERLSSLSVAITKRNSKLELPYNYLNPTEIENSVAT